MSTFLLIPASRSSSQTPQTRAGLNLGAGGNPLTVIKRSAADRSRRPIPNLGAGASFRWPKFGNQCALVNEGGKNKNVNNLSQQMTVAAGDVDAVDGLVHVRFVAAPVLENPAHTAPQQPYYFVQLTNNTSGAILYTDFNLSAQAGVPWKISNGFYYTDWQLVDIAPGAAKLKVGDQVTLDVIGSGCSLGGHFGQIYVDGVGTSISCALHERRRRRAGQRGNEPHVHDHVQERRGDRCGGREDRLQPAAQHDVREPERARPRLHDAGRRQRGSRAVHRRKPRRRRGGQLPVDRPHRRRGDGNAHRRQLRHLRDRDHAAPRLEDQDHHRLHRRHRLRGRQLVQRGRLQVHADAGERHRDPDRRSAHAPTLNGTCTAQAGALVCTSAVCDAADNDCGFGNGAGPCSAGNASVVCRSAVCDAADTKCGYANGDGPCTLANAGVVCRSLVCDPDLKCGYAVGDGPCTVANGPKLCRSGACSVNGTCEPAGGCNVDADCTAGNWCSEATHICTPRLANGSAVPTDAPHTNPTLNGTCTAPAATLVCASSVCDTVDNACGYANGEGRATLATRASCVAPALAIPSRNAVTRWATAPAATANGATVCRSGACSVNGTCEPTGGCNVDADCAGGNWCQEATHVCTPRLSNGTALPTDAPHTNPTLNGACTAAAATLVCTSQVCDVADASAATRTVTARAPRPTPRRCVGPELQQERRLRAGRRLQRRRRLRGR